LADNLLKRFSNATVAENGNLCWRVETRSGHIDVQCDKNDLIDMFTFLVQLAASSPLGTKDTDFASFPLNKIGLQKGPGADEVTMLVQTPGALNMGFRMAKSELQRFAATVDEMAKSVK